MGGIDPCRRYTSNNAKGRLSRAGDFSSDKVHYTERFKFTGADTLRYEATFDDPSVYTRPWTFAVDEKRDYFGGDGGVPTALVTKETQAKFELWEEVCQEGLISGGNDIPTLPMIPIEFHPNGRHGSAAAPLQARRFGQLHRTIGKDPHVSPLSPCPRAVPVCHKLCTAARSIAPSRFRSREVCSIDFDKDLRRSTRVKDQALPCMEQAAKKLKDSPGTKLVLVGIAYSLYDHAEAERGGERMHEDNTGFDVRFSDIAAIPP